MLYPCENDGFSVPVVTRSFVPVLDKGIAIACDAAPKLPAVGAVGVDKLTALIINSRIEH